MTHGVERRYEIVLEVSDSDLVLYRLAQDETTIEADFRSNAESGKRRRWPDFEDGEHAADYHSVTDAIRRVRHMRSELLAWHPSLGHKAAVGLRIGEGPPPGCAKHGGAGRDVDVSVQTPLEVAGDCPETVHRSGVNRMPLPTVACKVQPSTHAVRQSYRKGAPIANAIEAGRTNGAAVEGA